ncbi:hypothetical protein Ddc_14757 [Ditylenchus destructor]|nr:hypothetical protein Ddc_14757 [Ditylenchus destructor]
MSRYMSGCFLFLIVPFLVVVESTGTYHINIVKPGTIAQPISKPQRFTVKPAMTTVLQLKAAVSQAIGWGDHKIGLLTKRSPDGSIKSRELHDSEKTSVVREGDTLFAFMKLEARGTPEEEANTIPLAVLREGTDQQRESAMSDWGDLLGGL